jgi:predicted RND superfamily exporter protein
MPQIGWAVAVAPRERTKLKRPTGCGQAEKSLRQIAWLVLLAALLMTALAASGVSRIVRDGSVDAFVPMDHPAALARDAARDLFGIEDPVVIGLEAPRDGTNFTAEALGAVRDLHEALRTVDGVRKDDIQSLASEKAITGSGGDLEAGRILTDDPLTEAEVAATLARFRAMPMFEGVLASADGGMAVLIVPVEDPNHAEATVAAIRGLAEAHAPPGHRVHVAGVAAMNARLSEMVSTDTRIFVPAAVLVVLVTLVIAFRSLTALVGPLAVIVGSAAIAMGAMGWAGSHYYLITTALPVVVMAIAVADSLHIQSVYLKLRARDRRLASAPALREALRRTFLPVSLTTVTTVAAFGGLTLGAGMVPIREFGIFAAIGVASAWVLSLTVLPAIILLMELKPSARLANGRSKLDEMLDMVTGLSLDRPRLVLGAVAVLVAVMAMLASQARFDYERQRYFVAGDPVRGADMALNDRLGGINFLDVKVSAPEPEGLMRPEALAAMADLRMRISRLPHVARVTGVDQQMAHMHNVLTGAPEGQLPTAETAPAQYMFLYEASGGPEDFRSQIDLERTHALVRARLETDRFSDTEPVVRDLERIVRLWSAETGLEAEVSGRVAVNAGWMRQLADTHVPGLLLAILLVFLVTALIFRAPGPAILAMVPAAVGILFVYAAMGAFGIDIAPATSMTAAIATGLGIDFAIHLLAHVRRRRAAGDSLAEALRGDYVLVARACLWCALALAAALFTICLSSAPPLRWFGVLVAAGAVGSLVGAIFLIPGLLALAEGFKMRRMADVR